MLSAPALFENGAMASIHSNGESSNTSEPMLVFYGTEGFLSVGNPGNFDGKVSLIRKEEGSCVMPFTHG